MKIQFNRKRSVALFTALISIIIIFIGYSYYKNEEKLIRSAKEKELESIANLKCNEISGWYQDQLLDVNNN